MFKKSIMTLAIIAVSTASLTGAAFAKKHKWGWGGHHHKHHYIKIHTPTYYEPSCHYYKKKWKWTGSKYWKKKYKACLILND